MYVSMVRMVQCMYVCIYVCTYGTYGSFDVMYVCIVDMYHLCMYGRERRE